MRRRKPLSSMHLVRLIMYLRGERKEGAEIKVCLIYFVSKLRPDDSAERLQGSKLG